MILSYQLVPTHIENLKGWISQLIQTRYSEFTRERQILFTRSQLSYSRPIFQSLL
jgi:hypothetical protein